MESARNEDHTRPPRSLSYPSPARTDFEPRSSARRTSDVGASLIAWAVRVVSREAAIVSDAAGVARSRLAAVTLSGVATVVLSPAATAVLSVTGTATLSRTRTVALSEVARSGAGVVG